MAQFIKLFSSQKIALFYAKVWTKVTKQPLLSEAASPAENA